MAASNTPISKPRKRWMNVLNNPNNDQYDPDEASGTPLQRAVRQLAERRNMVEGEFASWTMGEILREAESVYGDELPEFWRVWRDWTKPGPTPPMGDL